MGHGLKLNTLHPEPKIRLRERFHTNDLPNLIPTTKSEMLLAGGFNCILETNQITR
jgi:hypothetical protein